MVRLRFSVQLGYEITEWPCDFIFNIQAARTRCQTIVDEHLVINQPGVAQLPTAMHTDVAHGNRFIRLRANAGPLTVRYDATVDILHHAVAPEKLQEMPIPQLPPEVLPYLYPSRYCESDKLNVLAMREFGKLPPGYDRVLAIQRWVQARIGFTSGASNPNTSAVDSLSSSAGVCRDFSHLMIALCRAMSIPARFATGIDYGADPALGPTDFHAYVEVFLSNRWYLFDASGVAIPMGFVRFGTGRDAADVPFATIFGGLTSFVPVVSIEAVNDPANGFEVPRHRTEALSTDGNYLSMS
ncbi:transglutaminase family protein [Uliginosibacterium sp. H3]|uniref:Transglutaminase family protein n=1 Tax=Uliginosibacterium silvisoli TaxID=3114758 RepID=A0ABU6JZJ2_9RHOO|nr:transglutaminase family protein [Uliginosibacterium sp. H3]